MTVNSHLLLNLTIILLITSCNSPNTIIVENTIEGTLQIEQGGNFQEHNTITEFEGLEVESEYIVYNDILDGIKNYNISFTDQDDWIHHINISLQRTGELDNTELLGDGNWRFKTVEDQLDFFTSSGYGFIGYDDASEDIRHESIINRSKIVETEAGEGVLVDLEISDGLLYGLKTITSGGIILNQYFKVHVEDFRLQFLVDFESF